MKKLLFSVITVIIVVVSIFGAYSLGQDMIKKSELDKVEKTIGTEKSKTINYSIKNIERKEVNGESKLFLTGQMGYKGVETITTEEVRFDGEMVVSSPEVNTDRAINIKSASKAGHSLTFMGMDDDLKSILEVNTDYIYFDSKQVDLVAQLVEQDKEKNDKNNMWHINQFVNGLNHSIIDTMLDHLNDMQIMADQDRNTVFVMELKKDNASKFKANLLKNQDVTSAYRALVGTELADLREVVEDVVDVSMNIFFDGKNIVKVWVTLDEGDYRTFIELENQLINKGANIELPDRAEQTNYVDMAYVQEELNSLISLKSMSLADGDKE